MEIPKYSLVSVFKIQLSRGSPYLHPILQKVRKWSKEVRIIVIHKLYVLQNLLWQFVSIYIYLCRYLHYACMLWTPAGEQNRKCYWNNLLFTASHCRQHGSFSRVINFQSIFHSARICRILLNNSVEKILRSLKQKIKLQSRIKSGSNGPKNKVSNRQKIIQHLHNIKNNRKINFCFDF